MRHSFTLLFTWIAIAFFGSPLHAKEPIGAVLSPYVNDDTFLTAYLNLAALPQKPANEGLEILTLLPLLDNDAQAVMLALQGTDHLAHACRDAGGDAAYLVVGLAEMNRNFGPIGVIHLQSGVSAADAAKKLSQVVRDMDTQGVKLEARAAGENLVLIGKAPSLDRYAKFPNGERPDLIEPLTKQADSGAVVATVFSPGPDFRRVLRELWPQLPGPLAELRGELADKWQRLEIGLVGSPTPVPRFALEASDKPSAELFAKLWNEMPAAVTAFGDDPKVQAKVKGYAQTLVGALPARVEGTRVIMEFPAQPELLKKLGKMINEAADASLESSRYKQRVTRFRDITLGLLNFESAKKQLPPAAIRDKEGKPLLSWRVAILPYLGEIDLYKQFHLDEPWDSPHNRPLVEKMPAVYSDSDPKLKDLVRAGKTTYLVPIGPETVFDRDEGTRYRDVSDGTNKTIFVVEVEPSRAVEWTKPEDWSVNLEKPLDGVTRTDRKAFVAAFGDGHVESIPVNVDSKKLRGLLTRAGHELFDWP